jgi:quinol monooxygenase YgiN
VDAAIARGPRPGFQALPRHATLAGAVSVLQHPAEIPRPRPLQPEMFIATLFFDVRPDKRIEFISAAGDIVNGLRARKGCLGCRLATDCENENLFLLVSEWDSRPFLDRYLASDEYRIIEGTRILLRDGPALAVDEVLSRLRAPRPRRPLRLRETAAVEPRT